MAKKGTIVANEACPSCKENGRDRSSNHLMVFEDGGKYCNRCKYTEKPDEDLKSMSRSDRIAKLKAAKGDRRSDRSFKPREPETSMQDILTCGHHAIPSRRLKAKILEMYDTYTMLDEDTGEIQKAFFGYRRKGRLVTFKGRRMDIKEFLPTVGDKFKDIDLFGSHLWNGPKYSVILCEGEIDCMAAYDMMARYNERRGVTYQPHVGSIPNGAGGAARDIASNWKTLKKYDKVVICFDNDEEGRKAIRAVAKAVPAADAHKIHVMRLPEEYKDANDVLIAKKPKVFVDAFFAASPYMPSEIVSGAEVSLQSLVRPLVKGVPLPWPGVEAKLRGGREGELTIVTGGSGVGKTTFTRILHYHYLHEHNKKVFGIYLEDGRPSPDHPMKAAQSLIGLHNNIALPRLRVKPQLLSKEKWERSYDTLINNGRSWFIDHFGGMSVDELMEQLMYAHANLQADVVILDHISMLFSGQRTSATGNERKDIDLLMTELAKFCSKTGMSIIAISHISKGAEIQDKTGRRYIKVQSLDDLRGSSAIGQLSWNVIALNKLEGNLIEPLILKNREWGNLGPCTALEYSDRTGWLTEIEDPDEENEND